MFVSRGEAVGKPSKFKLHSRDLVSYKTKEIDLDVVLHLDLALLNHLQCVALLLILLGDRNE